MTETLSDNRYNNELVFLIPDEMCPSHIPVAIVNAGKLHKHLENKLSFSQWIARAIKTLELEEDEGTGKKRTFCCQLTQPVNCVFRNNPPKQW